MRETKFRGYRNFGGNQLYPADKRWIYGYYSFRDRQHRIQDIDDMSMTYVVEPDSVGEFTGLKDKNGVEIYEGDILENYYFGYERATVIFHLGTFKAEPQCFSRLSNEPFNIYEQHIKEETTDSLSQYLVKWKYGSEVIGNIYESRRVLEQDDQ